jgi:hypothetical protein
MSDFPQIDFWPFVLRSIARAIHDARSFVGLDLKTIAIAMFCAFSGWFLIYKVKGLPALQQQLGDQILLGIAPTILLVALLLIYNMFRAPYLIYQEEYVKAAAQIAALTKEKTTAETQRDAAQRALAEEQKKSLTAPSQPPARRELSRAQCDALAQHIAEMNEALRVVQRARFDEASRTKLSDKTKEIRAWLAQNINEVAAQSFFAAPPMITAYEGMPGQFGGLWQQGHGRLNALREIANRVC